MRIFTGSIENCRDCKSLRIVCIAGDKGKQQNYVGDIMPELAPKKVWWTVWHNMKESQYEKIRFYVENYYKTVLKALDPGEVAKSLDNSVVLCYEDSKEFCHRFIVAAWLEIFFPFNTVREIRVMEDGSIRPQPQNKFITIIKEMLQVLIMGNMDMNGYTTIAAAYACEQAKKVAGHDEPHNSFGISEVMYMNLAEAIEKSYGNQGKQK